MGTLFVPSAMFWGTNILKDPICIFGMGLCLSTLHNISKGRLTIKNVIEFAIGATLLVLIKVYIIAIFLVAMLFAMYRSFLIQNNHFVAKLLVRIAVNISVLWGLYLASINSEMIGEFLYANFALKAEAIQNSQIFNSEGGSGYVLPNINDFSAGGIFRSYLQSLNVALFRPYLWETKSALMLLNALESAFILLLTAYLLIRTKVIGFFAFSLKKPILLFSLVFTLLLGPLAGFISFNFGTLSRYKLPFVPLFYTYLLLLYKITVDKKKQKTLQ
jgi:hypothetical protein